MLLECNPTINVCVPKAVAKTNVTTIPPPKAKSEQNAARRERARSRRSSNKSGRTVFMYADDVGGVGRFLRHSCDANYVYGTIWYHATQATQYTMCR